MKIEELEKQLEDRGKSYQINKTIGQVAYTAASGCVCYLLAQMGFVGIVAAVSIVIMQIANTLALYQQLKAQAEYLRGLDE
jgi:hypothetical protein